MYSIVKPVAVVAAGPLCEANAETASRVSSGVGSAVSGLRCIFVLFVIVSAASLAANIWRMGIGVIGH